MFTTPPGTSEVASTSPSETAGSGDGSLARTTVVFPDTMAGASRETRPRSAWSGGATIPTTPVGSGIVKLKYGPATGFVAPRSWPILSAHPAYQTQRSIEASTPSARVLRARVGQLGLELGPATLHQLGHAVQDLRPVVRGLARPLRLRGARGPDRVAQVLARRARGAREQPAVVREHLVRAPRLAARELAGDVELRRPADRDPRPGGHPSSSRYGSSPCRPPSRPNPLSL